MDSHAVLVCHSGWMKFQAKSLLNDSEVIWPGTSSVCVRSLVTWSAGVAQLPSLAFIQVFDCINVLRPMLWRRQRYNERLPHSDCGGTASMCRLFPYTQWSSSKHLTAIYGLTRCTCVPLRLNEIPGQIVAEWFSSDLAWNFFWLCVFSSPFQCWLGSAPNFCFFFKFGLASMFCAHPT